MFDPSGGDHKPEDQLVTGGEKIERPSDPKRDGYTFEGWYYTDENGKEQKWDFNDSLNQGIELKAKWTRRGKHLRVQNRQRTPKKNPRHQTKSRHPKRSHLRKSQIKKQRRSLNGDNIKSKEMAAELETKTENYLKLLT